MGSASGYREFDRRCYVLARDYLLQQEGVTSAMLARYLVPPAERPADLAGIYRRLLESAQSSSMGPTVIGGALGGLERLGPLLCDFEPAAITRQYTAGWEPLLELIVARLAPRGQIRRSPQSLWPRFCRSILSGARFLSRFDSAADFYRWVDRFNEDERARLALPLLLSAEIDGFGFPLACEFIKELGYAEFAKPDVHLKKIFVALGLCEGEGDRELFHAITRIARHVGVTPYAVDKLFWLVGSGNFYLDGIHLRGQRAAFIARARQTLQLEGEEAS